MFGLLFAYCGEVEQVDLVPDQQETRSRLLAACGQTIKESFIAEDENLKWKLDVWREEYRRLLEFSELQFDQMIVVTRADGAKDILSIDYYYISDWVYLTFSFRTGLAGVKGEDAVRQKIADELFEGPFYPLWDVPPMVESETRDLIQHLCGRRLERAECPDVRLVERELWYRPEPAEESETGPPAAINLNTQTICCGGINRDCR